MSSDRSSSTNPSLRLPPSGEEQTVNLHRDNAEIEHQRTLQRMQKAGELLEALTFWPSPNADQNLARDIGRVLQGKSPERSSGVEETLSDAGAFVMSWKQKAAERDALKDELAKANQVCEQLSQRIDREHASIITRDMLMERAEAAESERDALKDELQQLHAERQAWLDNDQTELVKLDARYASLLIDLRALVELVEQWRKIAGNAYDMGPARDCANELAARLQQEP